MTLFTSLYHLTGSMRSLAISKLSQCKKGKRGEGENTGIWKKKTQSQNYEKNKTLANSSNFAVVWITLHIIFCCLSTQVEIFHTAN